MRSQVEAGNNSDPHTDTCVVDTGVTSDGKNSDFMLIAENNAALCNGPAVTEVVLERDGTDVDDQNFDATAPSSAVHHIATRSATGRLAKRPRKDLSPARSPPRKIGIYSSLFYQILLLQYL